MPHVVALELTHSEEAPAAVARHWLLDALYGRDLLKARLRKVWPDLGVKSWALQEELDHLLERTIDELGLRNWPEPRGHRARLRYVPLVLRMMLAVDRGVPPPPWQDG